MTTYTDGNHLSAPGSIPHPTSTVAPTRPSLPRILTWAQTVERDRMLALVDADELASARDSATIYFACCPAATEMEFRIPRMDRAATCLLVWIGRDGIASLFSRFAD